MQLVSSGTNLKLFEKLDIDFERVTFAEGDITFLLHPVPAN